MGCRAFYFLVILFSFSLCACQSERKDTSAEDVSSKYAGNSIPPEMIISRREIQRYLLENIERAEIHPVISGVVKHFYQSNEQFLWLGSYYLEPQTDSLLIYLRNSVNHGLNPETFHLSKMEMDIGKLNRLDFKKGADINKTLADLEYNLTEAYLEYACGLSYGFVNPHRILNNLEDEEGKDGKPLEPLSGGRVPKKELYSVALQSFDHAFVDDLLKRASGREAASVLNGIQPADEFYVRLQSELKKLNVKPADAFPQIPLIGDSLLKLGNSNNIVPLVAQRLKLSGELSPESPFTGRVLTQELLDAINLFRKENRMPPDSSLGSLTIRALNRPVDYYKNRLRINLERLRWKPVQQMGERYVLVNIAAAMLQAIDSRVDTMLEMKVCVGNKNNKTPLLASMIRYVEFNPYWNVPQSIILKEIIPSFRKDTAYFTKNRFRVYDKEGRVVNPHKINWADYREGVPFDVKQDNKDGNALGRMIFRFPNTQAIYLHDTPAKYGFKLANRAISHGCVRLEKPLYFAFFLTGSQEEVMRDRIRLAVGLHAVSDAGRKLEGNEAYKELEFYSFKPAVPVFIEYYTNYLSGEGELSYCDDPYNYDPPLLEALNRLNGGFKTEKSWELSTKKK